MSDEKPLWYFTSPSGKLVRMLALELLEQLLRHLAQHVHQHVQPPAMRHADHDLLHAGRARALDQLVDRRDQALAAFERKALLAHVARMQVALELLGLGQLLQQALLHLGRVFRRRPDRLDALLDPVALHPLADEHVLEADVAAVGVAQRVDQVPERGAVEPDERAGADLAVEIRLGEVVVAPPRARAPDGRGMRLSGSSVAQREPAMR